MPVKLSEKNIADIERCLNHRTKTEVIVKVEQGRVAIVLVERKKIT